MTDQADFAIGQIVIHRLFGYRGVIFEVDPSFNLSEEWYQTMARSRPPKDAPWYQVLVDNAAHTTYVAQQNLRPSDNLDPINHPELDQLFERFDNGHYVPRRARVQ